MLNLPVAMNVFLRCCLIVWLGLDGVGWIFEKPQITSPGPGDALQGVVTITGTSRVTDFASCEISFRFANDPTDTWYLIQQSRDSVKDGALAAWDTTTIADGEYRLRIMVILSDGQEVETIVDGLRVRNYTPIETVAPAMDGQAALLPDDPPTQSSEEAMDNPTATPLPVNPASVTNARLIRHIFLGGISALILFLLLLFYRWLTQIRRNR